MSNATAQAIEEYLIRHNGVHKPSMYAPVAPIQQITNISVEVDPCQDKVPEGQVCICAHIGFGGRWNYSEPFNKVMFGYRHGMIHIADVEMNRPGLYVEFAYEVQTKINIFRESIVNE